MAIEQWPGLQKTFLTIWFISVLNKTTLNSIQNVLLYLNKGSPYDVISSTYQDRGRLDIHYFQHVLNT